MPLTPVLTKRFGTNQPWKIANYEALDGYSGLRAAFEKTPDELIEIVRNSNLRGRGGAGFPTGMKWAFIPQAKPGEPVRPHYVVVNADEGEPGTCRDLPLMMNDPHSMIEGIIIACYAVRAEHAFIYIRGEAVHAIRRVIAAVGEAYESGYLGRNILGSGFDCEMTVHGGAGAYICGEETALLDSLEGKRGQPRLKPPFPATNGLYDAPTVVNNVGSLASVPYIVLGGSDWFKLMGPDGSPGPCIYSLSGRIANPGQYEAPMGSTLRELIDMAGGMSRGKPLKFWTPGGSSTPLFTVEHMDVPLDFDSTVKAGSMLGTSAMMIFDEDDSVVRAVLKWTEFYEHESCGKCTPCREGNYWTAQILERILHGGGTEADLDTLVDICDNILGRSFCALGDGATSPITSSLQYFRDDYLALIPGASRTQAPASPEHTDMTLAQERPATAEDLITVTIDGQQVSVPKGTLIIRAAEEIGIQIPRFCDHPLLDPAGACRQCLIEVTDMGNGRGMPKPAAACTTTVMPGMVVATQLTSVVADKAQQGVMELLLINHPLDCPICDKGGECPLQNQAMSNGRADSRFHDVKRTFPKPVAISSNVLLDRERCVLCQRCTRFSDQIAGDPFIDLLERGAQQQIGTSDEVPFQSYFSGNTVQICPVGALTGASYRFRARPFDLMSTPTVCEHCSSGCALRNDWRRSTITRRMAANDPDVNEEWNCDKGRWAFHNATQSDRLTVPLVRDESGRLVQASWPEALERAAAGLTQALDAGGVGVLPGGRLTEEDAYAYAKFARVVLGTNDVDFRARPGSDEELAFLGAHVAGTTPDHVSYASLETAPVVLLVGLEPEEESPIVFLRLRKSTRLGRTRVHAVAPFASRGLIKLDGTLIPCRPGGEAELLSAPDSTLRDLLGRDGAVILVGERMAMSAGALTAAATLADRTGARLAWVPRRAGERGAVDAGALPTLLPGGRPVADDMGRLDLERGWSASLPTTPGRDLATILRAARDGELAALVVGGVELADLPDPELAAQAWDRVGFLVSLEIRLSDVTERADVVFPVAPPAEKAGRYVTWEGRRRPFVSTLTGTGALADGRVLHALADELDVDLGIATTEAARAEIARIGLAATRPGMPAASSGRPPSGVLLATWPELIDAGRMSVGDENLAGTAKPARALLSAATAARAGVVDGGSVTVSTERGSITVPVVIDDLPADVVWLPTNARGCAVRSSLGAVSGDAVSIRAAGRAETSAGGAQ